MTHGLVGTKLSHYRLDAPLGGGAMSEGYVGTDTNLGKKVAVKVIHPLVALHAGQVARFQREARAAARLQHPHVAAVHYAGTTTAGSPFYAMELIRGWSLDEIIDSRIRFRLEQALALFAQACSGLDAASKAGLIGATRALALEVAKRNITVNAVSPGFIETDMSEGLAEDALLGMIPCGRLGSPDDVAAAVCFLAAEQSSYITGQVIGVNGGLRT